MNSVPSSRTLPTRGAGRERGVSRHSLGLLAMPAAVLVLAFYLRLREVLDGQLLSALTIILLILSLRFSVPNFRANHDRIIPS